MPHDAYRDTRFLLLGEAPTDDFMRLYLLPGVHHCSGGRGPEPPRPIDANDAVGRAWAGAARRHRHPPGVGGADQRLRSAGPSTGPSLRRNNRPDGSRSRSCVEPRYTTLTVEGSCCRVKVHEQPHRCVAVECPIRLADGAYLEEVRPSAQPAVHLVHQLCGFLPCPRSVCQCMDLLNHALDALLRWPVRQAHLTGSR